MLPWGHLAVGYIVFSLAVRSRRGSLSGAAVLALAVGTQFPDLIDKPLVTWVSLLPSGRSLGHSLLFALCCGVGLWLLGPRFDRLDVAAAFLVGQLTHIAADAIGPAMAGRWAELGFLAWPVTPAYRYSADGKRVLVKYLFTHLTTPPQYQLVLFGVAVALWVVDGRPGLLAARDWLRERYRRSVSP